MGAPATDCDRRRRDERSPNETKKTVSQPYCLHENRTGGGLGWGDASLGGGVFFVSFRQSAAWTGAGAGAARALVYREKKKKTKRVFPHGAAKVIRFVIR